MFQIVRLNEKANIAITPMDLPANVLIKNDKDPVKTYFDGGIEFCERIKKGL